MKYVVSKRQSTFWFFWRSAKSILKLIEGGGRQGTYELYKNCGLKDAEGLILTKS
jgi:hypothetical protein